MSDHYWHKNWNRPDEHSDRHDDCPHHHHAFHQDDEPHLRTRGGRSDIHEDRDRGDAPERHFRNDHGDRGQDQDNTPDASMPSQDGGNLGWDTPWEDAGGLEALLFDYLSSSPGPIGGSSPIIVFAIDDLNVEFNTLIQTTQIQNTLVFLNASNGSSIDIGGDVNATGLQSASVEQSAGLMNLPDFA
jgi:hypothetical protein